MVACDKTDGDDNLQTLQDITQTSYPENLKDVSIIGTRKDANLQPSVAALHGKDEKNPRVLKKHSVEAINRRNILESCKKSSAKDTIVEASTEYKPEMSERNTTSIISNLTTSGESTQKAVISPNYDILPTNTSRTNGALAKERRSISSSSRATSFPLGIDLMLLIYLS